MRLRNLTFCLLFVLALPTWAVIDTDYTRATNSIEADGGTAGAPHNMGEMYLADLAGTLELLAATTCTTNMTLTY